MDKHQAHKQRYPGGIPRSASAWHSVGLASMRNGTQFASRRSIVQPCLFCGLCVRTIRRLPRSDHLPRSSEALALLEAKFIYLLEKLRHHAFEQLGEHHRRTRGPSLCGTSVGVIPPSCGAISPPIDEMRGVCHHTGWKPLDVASQNLETDSCLAPLLLRRPHARLLNASTAKSKSLDSCAIHLSACRLRSPSLRRASLTIEVKLWANVIAGPVKSCWLLGMFRGPAGRTP